MSQDDPWTREDYIHNFERDCFRERYGIVNLIIDHIKIGFASGDVNPLDKVILVDKHSELVKINKSDSICVPTNHREVVVRWYNSAPSLHAEAVQEFKNRYKQ